MPHARQAEAAMIATLAQAEMNVRVMPVKPAFIGS
jgi:hypothetical protein